MKMKPQQSMEMILKRKAPQIKPHPPMRTSLKTQTLPMVHPRVLKAHRPQALEPHYPKILDPLHPQALGLHHPPQVLEADQPLEVEVVQAQDIQLVQRLLNYLMIWQMI